MKFINESKNEFKDISTEEYRKYIFPSGKSLTINKPLKLNVNFKSGGHRIFNKEGKSFYIASTWIAIEWKAREGKANFVL